MLRGALIGAVLVCLLPPGAAGAATVEGGEHTCIQESSSHFRCTVRVTFKGEAGEANRVTVDSATVDGAQGVRVRDDAAPLRPTAPCRAEDDRTAVCPLPDADEHILTVDGGDGDDTITFAGEPFSGALLFVSAYGGDGDDTITGFTANEVLDGGEGDDRIEGGEGGDSVAGRAGNDVLIPDDGPTPDDADRDDVRCGAGRDRVEGMAANDFAVPGCEHITVLGQQGAYFVPSGPLRSPVAAIATLHGSSCRNTRSCPVRMKVTAIRGGGRGRPGVRDGTLLGRNRAGDGRLTVGLSARGRALLARHKKLDVQVTVIDGSGRTARRGGFRTQVSLRGAWR